MNLEDRCRVEIRDRRSWTKDLYCSRHGLIAGCVTPDAADRIKDIHERLNESPEGEYHDWAKAQG